MLGAIQSDSVRPARAEGRSPEGVGGTAPPSGKSRGREVGGWGDVGVQVKRERGGAGPKASGGSAT